MPAPSAAARKASSTAYHQDLWCHHIISLDLTRSQISGNSTHSHHNLWVFDLLWLKLTQTQTSNFKLQSPPPPPREGPNQSLQSLQLRPLPWKFEFDGWNWNTIPISNHPMVGPYCQLYLCSACYCLLTTASPNTYRTFDMSVMYRTEFDVVYRSGDMNIVQSLQSESESQSRSHKHSQSRL